MQDCTLAEPGGPWRPTFALGRLEIKDTGHPRFYMFRALGSLQFSLEHSLGMLLNIVHGQVQKR